MKDKCPYKDDYGNELYEGDFVKIGQLKGKYIVVNDFGWRMKSENSDSGYGFGITKYPVKKISKYIK